MNTIPTDRENENAVQTEPNPSLRGIYEDPDGTFETGDPNADGSVEKPASVMNSGVDPFRRGDALEPAAQHPDTLVPDTPQASASDQLAENPIQPKN